MQPTSETAATAESAAALDVAEDELPITRAWDDAVRTHAPTVYRLAHRLTGNPYDAEDLTQDVFVRVFRSWTTFTPGRGTFEGWLLRITTNLFIDEIRRRQRLRLEPLRTQEDRLVSRESTPAEVHEERILGEDVQAALNALGADFRAAVVLRDLEGYSYDEIAAITGVKSVTVGTRIHRGRARLRGALAHRASDRR